VKTGKRPLELALDAGRGRLYVTSFAGDRVFVIGTISDSVLATIRVGKGPFGIAVDADANRAFVANAVSDTVSVLDGDRCEVAATIPVGRGPLGLDLDLERRRALVANGTDSTLSIIDTEAGRVVSTLAIGKTPVAFGDFVAPLGNDCARAPLVCDDADPMTLDSCVAGAGCRFAPSPPSEAAEVGLAVLDSVIREAGVDALGGATRAALLSRLSVDARSELVEGIGTPRKRIARADRRVRRLGAVVRAGIRRGQMRCGVATRVLDLARGVHAQLKLARRGASAA
jgi:YVTN family beta-propeller protein